MVFTIRNKKYKVVKKGTIYAINTLKVLTLCSMIPAIYIAMYMVSIN